MLFRRISSQASLLVSAGIVGISSLAASPLDETVNILQQWVETERMISTARTEWEQEKASIQDLISIYRDEGSQLDQAIADAAEAVSVAESRRADLLARDDELKALESQVLAALIQTEKRIKALQPLLPEPIQQELSPLFRAIPDKPEDSKLAIGSRIQPIVGILAQIQRFNQVVTVTEGFREFEAGKTVQTEKIYFGLGTAYYVDGANLHAGVGVLTANGWQWEDDDSLVPVVRQFVEIYRGSKQASYLPMPVKLR